MNSAHDIDDDMPGWLRSSTITPSASPLLGYSPHATLIQANSVLETVIAQLRSDAEEPLAPICRYGIAHVLEVAAHAILVVSDHMDAADAAARRDGGET
jgi:hypothetical protein